MRQLILLAMLTTGCDQGGGGNGPNDTGAPTGNTVPDKGDFSVAYVAAETEDGQLWEQYLLQSGLLEGAADGINRSFALPYDAQLVSAECGMVNAFWVADERSIVLCYELLTDILVALANSGFQLDDDQLTAATTNTYLWVLYHEMGHALVTMLDLPITGKEEDAVDEFSTVIFVEAGMAYVAADAIWYFALMDNGEHPPSALADEHSLGLQRFYNVLCLVYGSDPATYQATVDSFPEMASRAPRCEDEYAQKKRSWERLLAPYAL